MHRLLTDEYVQVLVLVCLPLSLGLLAILVALARGGRTVAKFPTFSVSISSVSREDAYVSYCDPNNTVEFYAAVGGGVGRRRQIRMQIPKEMLDEDVRSILPKLALGLEKLRFKYRIYGHDGTLLVAEGMRHGGAPERNWR